MKRVWSQQHVQTNLAELAIQAKSRERLKKRIFSFSQLLIPFQEWQALLGVATARVSGFRKNFSELIFSWENAFGVMEGHRK